MTAATVSHASSHGDFVDHDRKLRFGMVFYIVTDMVFVTFLFVSYIWLRAYNTGGSWFPDGTKLPDTMFSNILTGLLVLGAICFFVAYQGLKAGNQGLLRVGSLVAFLLVVAALVGQFYFMGHLPFVTQDGSFASTYLMLSGYHIYHLLLATFLGLGVTIRAFRGKYDATRTLGVRIIGYFMYWAAAMPVLLWLMLTLLPPKV